MGQRVMAMTALQRTQSGRLAKSGLNFHAVDPIGSSLLNGAEHMRQLIRLLLLL